MAYSPFCEIAYVPLWTGRLWASPEFRRVLLANPVAFSAWYLLADRIAMWPKEVVELVAAFRDEEISFEDAADALRRANLVVRGELSLAYARRLLEGYEVWRKVRREPANFLDKAGLALSLDSLAAESALQARHGRTGKLSSHLGLKGVGEQMLFAAVATAGVEEFSTLIHELVRHDRRLSSLIWQALFGCTREQLEDATGVNSALRASRLLTLSEEGLPAVSTFWARKLLEGGEVSLLDELVEPLPERPGVGMPARLAPEDADLATRLLKADATTGVNLLLYGAETLERRTQLSELLRAAGRTGYVLKEPEGGSHRDLPAIAYVAQHLLHAYFPTGTALVLERPSDVLPRRGGGGMFARLFGLEQEPTSATPFEELVLGGNRIPVVWAGPGSQDLSEEAIARFVFHAPLRKASRTERREQLAQHMEGLALTQDTQGRLLALEEVSALQLQTALKAARLAGARTRKQREDFLVQAVRRSLKALKRATEPVAKECVTDYSLEYLNYSGRFGPKDLVTAFKRNPKGSLCLYGLPGTGKTQFVEHLAQQLGMPLIAKRASDLMSKWVGENEKNLAAMFQEATDNNSVLFLDEADSFLRDRSQAGQQWEVSQVNELLQQMERFNGIFVIATNLFQGLDLAALRRFSFKLEFRELSAEQRLAMFLRETGLDKRKTPLSEVEREKYWEDLCLLPKLAAGDFATVKRQCNIMGVRLTPLQWIEQLKVECQLKSQHQPSQARVAMD